MNRLTFVLMNYRVDIPLNGLLSKAMDSGIKSIESKDKYEINIYFNDGSSITEAWNVNKYYAWLQSGVFTYPNKKTYEWHCGRPKRSTMVRLLKMMKNISY